MFVVIYFQNKTKYFGGVYTTMERACEAQKMVLGDFTPYYNGCVMGNNGIVSWTREINVDSDMWWSLGINDNE